MNLDDFKSDWKEQHNELAKDRFDTLDADMASHVTRFESAIRRRDLIETAAAVFVVVFFGVFLWFVPCPTIMQVGIGIIILGVIEAVAVMHWTRHRDEQPKQDLPLLDYCTAEIKRVDRQIQLLRSVNWWYSGPMLLGCCVMIYGMLSSIPELPGHIYYGFMVAFYACFLAAGYFIYRINAKAVESELVPIRNDLVELVQSREDDLPESDGN